MDHDTCQGADMNCTSLEDESAEPKSKKMCSGFTAFLKPAEIRHAVLNNSFKQPVVFKGYLSESRSESGEEPLWKCLKWGARDWGKLFGEKMLSFRIGTRVKKEMILTSPQWESTCFKGDMTYSDFSQWAQGQKTCSTSCKLEVHSTDYWAYFDYFYLKDLEFTEQMEGNLDWGVFGFPERGVTDSTLWIGTEGANTPCHIDTYGCNLVTQISGRKRWVLFPECQSQFLSPTRIPYEESSIYSEVGFPYPNLGSHPKLSFTTPYVVTLEPGDVLFVPKQWWHFVENLEFAVSINTWLELPCDNEERTKESLVMYQVASICQGIQSLELITSVFNPNMADVATMASPELLYILAQRVFQANNFRGSSPKTDDENIQSESEKNESNIQKEKEDKSACAEIKGQKTTQDSALHQDLSNEELCNSYSVLKVKSMPFAEFKTTVLGYGSDGKQTRVKVPIDCQKHNHKLKQMDTVEDGRSPIMFETLKLIIDSFTDQRVISVLKSVIDEKLKD